MRTVAEIVKRDYVKVDAFWGMNRIQDLAEKTKTDFFLVTDKENFIGVMTKFDLIKSHPNRIVLDAMSGRYKYIEAEKSIWEAKELLDWEVDLLVVVREEKVIGIVTKNEIDQEVNRHIDIMTGLYKTDYIIYNSIKLLEQGREIAVIFFDINNFGYIDKNFGHVVGDKIIKETAIILKENTPEGMYLCRYGGDEFVILSDQSAETSKALAVNIVNKVKEHKFYDNIEIEVSAGISGGRRSRPRKKNLSKIIVNLLNIASLASTKAKKEKGNIVQDYRETIDELAM